VGGEAFSNSTWTRLGCSAHPGCRLSTARTIRGGARGGGSIHEYISTIPGEKLGQDAAVSKSGRPAALHKWLCKSGITRV